MALTILDGGVGHLLKSKGVERLVPGLHFNHLFAACALANTAQPALVSEAYQLYIDAGADVITANSFGCTRQSLDKAGRGGLAVELAKVGARLARDAATRSGRPVRVAGSLPPLGESYVAQGLAELEALQPEYQQLAAAMAPHVDLFVCETMCTSGEAAAAGTAAAGAGRPWWAAFTLEDSEKGLLRGGEPLAAAVRAIGQLPGLEAVLVNCCAPQAATAALPTLREAAPAHVAVGAYANGFLRTTSDWLEEGSSAAHLVRPPADEYDSHGVVLPEAYAAHARRWVELGAGIVGGCCGVGPEHVARLAALKAAGGNTASLRSPSRV